ncbi:uncharacterized protein C14orf93 homolog isoform X2 [Ahaetulla prasina]|uniref:uncharacterized protein C14orf93 homolog isoform X2 n=1 Tax=Ahaetulla prasina TaxID=499056 RepID=UPI0026471BA3|nr:uncharacterized protein C14orf93 homolog isoform X2 [Ahaetulla prasina]
MSFSATILFSPPHANEAKCCCCTCKQEPGAPVTAPPPPPPSSPPCTPITITGTGLTVQSSEQLLHVIYQRVEKAVSLAELALSLAKANNEALRRLEEDVAALCQGPVVALKASPLQVSEAPENEEELETEEFGNGVQVVIEELKQLGAASAAVGRPEPLDFLPGKLVHNVHNHIANEKRFDGAESIKSPWNISVVKFLLEKLKHELVSKHHNYTDKELKGACVAYFLTKRREYRNSLNPFKGLKEKEEKKLRSRRYRLFANRSGVARLLGSEEQRLWRGVTEELMSDEEDSAREAGVWVARPPRFRATPLSQLCYRLDANSKHGTKANRVYGPPSERLPSAEVQLLPPQLYNPHFQEEDPKTGTLVHVPTRKDFGPELSSFVEIKVEKDQ